MAGPADPAGDAAAQLRAAGRRSRRLRDFTRARTDLVRERTRCLQRLEKLLEDAMVKITSVTQDGHEGQVGGGDGQALIDGERDPRTIAELAEGPLRAKRDALAEALDGMFDSHHGVIAQALLDQVAFLDQRIAQMEARCDRGAGPGEGIEGST